jgi:hypothetical protein
MLCDAQNQRWLRQPEPDDDSCPGGNQPHGETLSINFKVSRGGHRRLSDRAMNLSEESYGCTWFQEVHQRNQCGAKTPSAIGTAPAGIVRGLRATDRHIAGLPNPL